MSATAISNRISFAPPPEAIQASQSALEVLIAQLVPHLRSLGTEDRRTMPRMGEKTESFVFKAYAYSNTNPEFLPAFIDRVEFQRDVDAITVLRPLRRALGQIVDMLDDSLAMAGSEAYMAALPYYLNAKAGAKLKQPGAATISDDLSTRFVGQGRPGKVAPPPASGPTANGTSVG